MELVGGLVIGCECLSFTKWYLNLQFGHIAKVK